MGVLLIGSGIREVDANEEEDLVHRIGKGVPGLRQHRGAPGKDACDEFAGSNREVRTHGGEDSRLALF